MIAAKVTVSQTLATPEELERLRAMAPPPVAGALVPIVVTAADRLRRAEREHDDARSKVVDESEIASLIEKHTKGALGAMERVKEIEAELVTTRQTVQLETALLQAARARKTDNREAVEAAARFDRARVELEAARAAVAEEQLLEAARAAVEKENRREQDHGGEGASRRSRTEAGEAEAQAKEGGGQEGGSQAQGSPEAQAGAQGGPQAQGNGQAQTEQQGGEVAKGQAGAPQG